MIRLLPTLLLLVLALAAPARAEFPEAGRPVTVIVPYPPGGGSDISARSLAPVLEGELGVPVVIVNRPGANPQIGLTQTARARPDGYTLCYGLWPSTITLYLDPSRNAGFTRESFTPLAMHVIDPGSIIVRADSPLRSLADLIAAARSRPGDLRVSDPGILSWEHLASIALQKQHGLTVNQVHYQGSAPALVALLAGETEVALVATGTAMAQSRAGTARTLAVLDDHESTYLPGVPTAAAQGTRIVTGSARGFIAPAGLPAEVEARLAQALERAITSPEHRQKMQELGLPIRFMGPEEFRRYWTAEEASLAPLVHEVVGSGAAN
ncbi:tripartite tricarboxylate transporter substrate binding protein [Siccirubricoccus sp. G192]|uniref:tripartite tricarboxylate transporter substrate binding protein n=1 Tax=Siccirubricoccus sp. G192 TaxID=2849651 RepID=UPI001C2BA419|nr:tripartite tricarboxylate transporter substrate binding protein [Siccirubricoccus sp. G192]MBV1796663.1 tripartite tricarboxylate transporter substrate binding protein [Siccirubricoccus sp. G192]